MGVTGKCTVVLRIVARIQREILIHASICLIEVDIIALFYLKEEKVVKFCNN